MEVEEEADRDLITDNIPHAPQYVALTIVISLSHHRAVHEQEHNVDILGEPQIFQKPAAQRFIVGALRRSARLGMGGKADNSFIPTPHGFLVKKSRALEQRDVLIGRAHARAINAQFFETSQICRDWREGIRFMGEIGSEDFHAEGYPNDICDLAACHSD